VITSSKARALVGATAALIAAMVSAVAIVVPAQAAEGATIEKARAFLAEYGADQATQDRLINDYLEGRTWDSLKSSAPVSTKKYSALDGDYTVNNYADGSIAVTRAEAPNASADGISGCTASGTSRNNCKIDMWVGLVAMSFNASYNLGNNTVTNVYGAGWSIGGACSVDLTYLGRPAANIGRMDLKAQMCGLPYSTTFWLQLKVSGGAASVSWTP
jgi:hypothetical protein